MTIPSITPGNQITLTIRGRQQLVDLNNPTLVEALASDNLDSACAKRTFREKFSDLFADFFGWAKQEDVITTLWEVAKAKDTVAIQNCVLRLAGLADDPRKFAGAFAMKTAKDSLGSPAVGIYLAGQHLSTVSLS